jgi:hypothetical protein
MPSAVSEQISLQYHNNSGIALVISLSKWVNGDALTKMPD